MEIFLDNKSAPVYGLLVSYMQVTDTKLQEETMIFNG
jgi:type III secretory pathway component EscS